MASIFYFNTFRLRKETAIYRVLNSDRQLIYTSFLERCLPQARLRQNKATKN
ncbi:hypothetical protein H6G93_07605 [Nostoc sp. FACHB-973]|nr:hypothetical protein [Nostoc sp. FACHB-973]MBX9253458.1 hypothetical protein [Desmonostoc muscorum CCALA 125]